MSNCKISDVIADMLVQQGISHVFGIIGSANAHLFDSIYRHPRLSLVCLHHEQACVMAAHGFYMQSGRMAAVLVTAGAGAANSLTGVVGAWADSVPVLILSGQESTKQFKGSNLCRMIGIQGIYSESVFSTCTKSVITCQDSEQVVIEVAKAIRRCCAERKGPCIVDIPIDLQAARICSDRAKILSAFVFDQTEAVMPSLTDESLTEIFSALSTSEAPLLWLGNGLRSLSGGELLSLVESLAIPYLTSWTGTDLLDPIPQLYAGHAGTYGSRAGNLILQSCDVLITLGTRLAIPQKGYVEEELARRAQIFVVDCDPVELAKLGPRFSKKYHADATQVIRQLAERLGPNALSIDPWLQMVQEVRLRFPLVEACHEKFEWIDSYGFMEQLSLKSRPNTSFVTDMGTALISGFQVIEPKGGQRLFTSQGLGEMGYGLPGSIGAWFADPTRTVICLNCDGGIMMNLQDLHSVISHGIPLKIVIFNNDGYLMIKHTQNAIVEGRRAGTDAASGMSCPNFDPLVQAFGFKYLSMRKSDCSDKVLDEFLTAEVPIVMEVFMDPEQLLVPKLSVSITSDGTLVSPPLEDLSPLIPLDTLQRFLLVPPHPHSLLLNRDAVEAKGDAIY
jgi:acetolactate synthase-1/2/3 large subunit